MKARRCLRLPFFCLASSLAWSSVWAVNATTRGYWENQSRGWHFYEDPEPAPRPSAAMPPPGAAQPTATAKAPELVEFEQLQRRLNETRTIAVMRPTDANVRRYMELEAKVVAQASLFADVAQRLAWSDPALDPTLHGRPVGAKAIETFESSQQSLRATRVAALSADHVLLFFYRSDCPFCHAFAPTLKAFERRYGLRVVAVSLDGGRLAEFPDARVDNGIATTLKVAQVPALFLAHPIKRTVLPIGYGVLSESQLLERIHAVTEPTRPLPDLSQALATMETRHD